MRGAEEGDRRGDIVDLAQATHGRDQIVLYPAIIRVRILRGATTFAVIPREQCSLEIDLVNAITAPLEAA